LKTPKTSAQRASQQHDQGSHLTAQGSINVEAGGDIAGTAVNLAAQDDLSLHAKGAMNFEPCQTRNTLDDQWYSRDKGFFIFLR